MSNHKRKRPKLPKRLFKKRSEEPPQVAPPGWPTWIKTPQNDAELAIAAANIRLPGREAYQAEFLKTLAIQRVVHTDQKSVVQVAAMLMMPTGAGAELLLPPRETPASYDDGVPVPPDVRKEMPPLEGSKFFTIENPRKTVWFADFDQKLSDFAISSACSMVRRSDVVPDVAVAAIEDGRVLGYACGAVESQNVVLINSDPGDIRFDRVSFIPASQTMRFPIVNVVWIAANYRRRGLAESLLNGLTRHFGVSPKEIAYEAPFTDAGLRLVQKFCGLKFIASCTRLKMVCVPLDKEDSLTPCNKRIVTAQEEMDAAQKLLDEIGYRPLPPTNECFGRLD